MTLGIVAAVRRKTWAGAEGAGCVAGGESIGVIRRGRDVTFGAGELCSSVLTCCARVCRAHCPVERDG